MHGNFEWYGQHALQRGLRVGFHGSSDGHVQTPGQPRRPGMGGRNADFKRRDTGYASGALTAVLAPELTRQALWDAFRARRTYATTGARILLDFRLNEQLMGAALKADGPPRLRVSVVGAAPLERVEVIRDDRLVLIRRGGGEQESFDFVDADCSRGAHHYYVRVSQIDGEFAWSSPIWFERLDGPDALAVQPPLWNADDPEASVELSPAEARAYEQRLSAYLEHEEAPGRWSGYQAVRVVQSPMGRFALIHANDHKLQRPVHFKLFLDYKDVVLRMDLGLRDFGQYPNLAAMRYADYAVEPDDRNVPLGAGSG
jgi:hypothetical protein